MRGGGGRRICRLTICSVVVLLLIAFASKSLTFISAPRFALCMINGRGAAYSRGGGVSGSDAIDMLIEEFSELLPDDFPEDISEIGERVEIGATFEYFRELIENALSRMLAFFLMLVGIVMLFALSEHCVSGLGASYNSAICAVLLLPAASGIIPLFERVSEGIESASAFFAGVIPIASAVCAAEGLSSTAAAEAAGMNLTLGIVSGVVSEWILPLIGAVFAMALIGSVSEGSVPSRLALGIKGLVGFLQGFVTTVIIAAFACQSVVTTAADGMAMRGIKYAISGMIPVVGSTVSSSISFLASGAGYAAKVIGVSSVLVIVYGFGAVMAELLAVRLAFTLAISLAQFSGARSAERGLSALRAVTDSLMTAFVSVAILYIAEIIIFIGCAGRAYA